MRTRETKEQFFSSANLISILRRAEKSLSSQIDHALDVRDTIFNEEESSDLSEFLDDFKTVASTGEAADIDPQLCEVEDEESEESTATPDSHQSQIRASF